MLYRWLAVAVVVIHLGFLVFVPVGALLAWRWPAVVWVHLPATAWAVLSVTVGLDCPLTSWEKDLRRLGREHLYRGGFIDHYVENVVYPQRFTPVLQAITALTVIVGYAGLIRRAQAVRRGPTT